MKKISNYLILGLGILILLISYNFDQKLSLLIKNIKLPLLDAVLGIITNFGVVIIAMLVVPSIILYKQNKKSAYLLFITFLISIVLAFIIKLIVLRQRPIGTLAYPFTNIINYSFPSMHSMVAFALLPILIKNVPRQKHFWVLFAFLVAFTRIYFGFHFLSDVIFGAFVGYFIGKFLLDLYKKKKLWIK